MDVSKYKALFIETGREHLSEVSRLLVALEDAVERGPLIDEVFRHVHSMKGMAASMGYDPIANLAHRLEDAVALQRSGAATLGQSTIDTLLRGVDAINAQVECVVQGVAIAEYPELLQALGAVAQGDGRGRAPGAAGGGPAENGQSPVVCVRLSASCPSPSVRAFLVYRRLSGLGTVAETRPPLEHIKSGHLTAREIRFVFSGAYDESEVQRVLAAVPDVESVTFEASGAGESHALPNLLRPAAESVAEWGKSSSTVRVRTDLLDDIMDTVGELFIARERLRLLLRDELSPEVRASLDGLGARIRQIHDQVIAARMMPMRIITDRYPRLVRDLCRSLGKDVELTIQGGEIELDRAILDNLDAPFVHTLRNALDHGIEAPAERLERGKATTGKVTISAMRDRDTVLVIIEDDGRGLDANRLREVAVQRGLVTAQVAEKLSVRECYFLICLPGFSTKGEVSDISGRGVGMDVVAAQIESVGGSLDIESEVGRGARFIFRLPLTLAIIPVLLVEAQQRKFAVPVAKVVAVRETNLDIFEQPDGSKYLNFQHALLPIVSLGGLLQLERDRLTEHVVVIEAGRDLYALGVDGIMGYREVVVKPLGDPLDRLEWYAGATILGDGQPILILDVPKALRLKAAA